MAGTDYTDKQLAEHMAQFEKDGTLPENSVFNPAGFARGEPILRKMTPDEIKAAGGTDAPAKDEEGEK
jgi:hypothetical protein